MARTTQREEKVVGTDPSSPTRGPTWLSEGMTAGPVPHQGPRGHQDFGGRESARHLKTGRLERGCRYSEWCGGGCPAVWCCGFRRDSAVRPRWPRRPGIGSQSLSQAAVGGGGVGGRKDCQDQLQISQAGVKCLRYGFPPLPSLPALLINNCVNSRVIVLGPQPLGLPGPGRCWQGPPVPHAGGRLGLAAGAAG